MSFDEVVEKDEVLRVWHRYEPWKVARYLDASKPLFECLGVAGNHREIQREIRDVRKRMRRVDGERGEDWENAVLKIQRQGFFRSLTKTAPANDMHPVFGECRKQLLGEQLLLHVSKELNTRRDFVSLPNWRATIRAGLTDFGCNLIVQRRNSHLIELIEVRSADCQKTKTLEQWHIFADREREHALVEVEPTQLAVDEARDDGLKVPNGN